MKEKYDYIVVGAGLAGLSVAHELSKKKSGLRILVIEKGAYPIFRGSILGAAFLYNGFALSRSKERYLIYRASCVGGTSFVSCNNAVVPPNFYAKNIGIDIRQ